MGLLNQFTSLFKLPGAYKKASDAAMQSQTLLQRVQQNQPVPKPLTQAPAPAPIAPPGAPAQSPQNDAISRALSGLTVGLTSLQKSIPSATQAPNPPPSPAAPDAFAPVEAEIAANAAPSAEETDTQKKLANLLASRDLGLLEAENKPIPLQAILGDQAKIEKRAAIESGTLQNQLAQLQARRQAALDVAKTKYDIETKKQERAKPDEAKIDEFINDQNQRVVVFKDNKTGKVRNEVVGQAQAKPQTQTEKDRAITVEVIKRARPLLIAAKGQDGYVDPSSYLKLRNDYAEAIGDPKDFDATFSPMLSPAERTRLGVGRVVFPPQNNAAAINELLASYLGG